MSGRSCTAGNQGAYATINAVEWGACDCGEGLVADFETGQDAEDDVPLFRCGERLACFGGCLEAEDV